MYTSKEESELLLGCIKPESCDMVCFAGKSKKDPYKNWNPVQKPSVEEDSRISAYDSKVWMPAWSETRLFDLLPHLISDPERNTVYELHITRKEFPGKGKFACVGYYDVNTGSLNRGFMSDNLTNALVHAVQGIFTSKTLEPGNFAW